VLAAREYTRQVQDQAPWTLAAAQHEDDQHDDHDEHYRSDTYIHWFVPSWR
jgi:hypothetical protein